jgi:outer membrane immunogenic protein
MRKSLLSIAAVAALFGTPALAADMALKASPMPPLVYDWTGPYVGATAGYVFGHSQHCDTPAFCTAGFDVDGFAGGGTLGYNWQVKNWWVVGLEADISGASARGTTVTVPGVFGCGSGCFTNLDWFGTVRGRIGPTFTGSSSLPFFSVFPYVTGGFAYGQIHAGLNPAPALPLPLDAVAATRTGWTVGAGIESALPWRNWSVKLEYLFFHLGDEFYDVQGICGLLSCTAVHNDFSLVRLGVNYHFSWVAPGATRY